MLSFLKAIFTSFKGGSFQVIVKLLGMIGLRVLESWMKRQEEKAEQERRAKRLEEGVRRASEYAGRESELLSSAIEEDNRILEMQEASSLEWLREQSKPSIKSSKIVLRGSSFLVETKNVLSGSPVFADKKWVVGSIDAKGRITLKLMSVGKRSIDVLLQDDIVEEKKIWLSIEVEVVEPLSA